MRKSKCSKCENFNKNLEFNCLYFKIKVEDLTIAEQCHNFLPKESKKSFPCRNCKNYLYKPRIEENFKNKTILDKRFYYCPTMKIRGTFYRKRVCIFFDKK
ncbi:hypothetical protein LI064_08570 [Clostridium perfringens]|uniref:hypothetical protein n=1 Tax=Clostridium perfringens TaxID=1502 RepID=UPI00224682A3|nr:hypothetical protein [Clostridium perfringens]MCX0354564.1 hypothetical protein [Clostridium perfringens]